MKSINAQRFFVHVHSDSSICAVYCLSEGSLCKVWFESEELENSQRWHIELEVKSSKPVTNEETMLEEFLTNEFSKPLEDFKLFNSLVEIHNLPGQYFERVFRPV